MHSMAQVSMMNPEAKQHVRLPDDVGMVRSITLEHCAHPQHAILTCTGSCLALISLSSDRVLTRVQLLLACHQYKHCWGKYVTKCSSRSVYRCLLACVSVRYDFHGRSWLKMSPAAFVHAGSTTCWALQKCWTVFHHHSHCRHTLWLQACKMEWWRNMICVVLGHQYHPTTAPSCTFLGIPSTISFPSNSAGWEYVCSGKVTGGMGAIPAGMLMP